MMLSAYRSIITIHDYPIDALIAFIIMICCPERILGSHVLS